MDASFVWISQHPNAVDLFCRQWFFSRFTLRCSCFTYNLKEDSTYWKYFPLSEVSTNTTFNVTVPAKQPCNAGLCPSPFPLPGRLVVILTPSAAEKRWNIPDLLSPASLQVARWARRAAPLHGSLLFKPNALVWRRGLASQTVPGHLEKPPLPVPWLVLLSPLAVNGTAAQKSLGTSLAPCRKELLTFISCSSWWAGLINVNI